MTIFWNLVDFVSYWNFIDIKGKYAKGGVKNTYIIVLAVDFIWLQAIEDFAFTFLQSNYF